MDLEMYQSHWYAGITHWIEQKLRLRNLISIKFKNLMSIKIVFIFTHVTPITVLLAIAVLLHFLFSSSTWRSTLTSSWSDRIFVLTIIVMVSLLLLVLVWVMPTTAHAVPSPTVTGLPGVLTLRFWFQIETTEISTKYNRASVVSLGALFTWLEWWRWLISLFIIIINNTNMIKLILTNLTEKGWLPVAYSRNNYF